MTQQSVSLGNIASWIVPDSSGQHQIIKVIQTSSKASILPTTSRGGNLTTALKAVVKPVTVDTSQGTSGQIICFKATKGITGNTGKRLIIPAANIKQLKTTNGTAPLILKQLSESDAQALYSPNCTNTILTQTQPSSLCNSKTAIEGSSNVMPTSQYNAKLDEQANSEPYCITPKHKQNNKSKCFITPILDHSGSRKRQELDIDLHFESNKKRRSEKGGVGLRQFSMKVCEKVKAKGITSYNEVADELVAEFADGNKMSCQSDQQYDQKNIRRRVYDALNVLMAMDIISKEKKEIKWIGLPTNSAQECKTLENERKKRHERIKYKTQQLHDLILQQIAFKNLVAKNKALEASQGPPAPNTAIQLPFIIVNTDRQTVIDCSISSDKMEYLFNFNDTFEIHDDIEVLKRMGFTLGLENGHCSEQNLLKAKSLVPKALSSYVEEIANNEHFGDVTSFEGLMNASPENDVMMELMLANQNASRPSSVLSYGGSGAGTATPSIADYESEHDSEDSSASEMF